MRKERYVKRRKAQWPQCTLSQKREREKHWCSFTFLLIHPRHGDHVMAPPAYAVDLPTPACLIYKPLLNKHMASSCGDSKSCGGSNPDNHHTYPVLTSTPYPRPCSAFEKQHKLLCDPCSPYTFHEHQFGLFSQHLLFLLSLVKW